MSFAEIGRELGFSREYIRIAYNKAMHKIKHIILKRRMEDKDFCTLIYNDYENAKSY